MKNFLNAQQVKMLFFSQKLKKGSKNNVFLKKYANFTALGLVCPYPNKFLNLLD